MNLNLIIPSPPTDFNSISGCSTPFASAPSSPPPSSPRVTSPNRAAGFVFFASAPASPTAAKLYAELTHNPSLRDADFAFSSPPSAVPFEWERSPGIPKNRATEDDGERDEFEFDFSGQLERTSLSADELFDEGRIKPVKPLKPPPGLQLGSETEADLSDSLRFRTAHSSPRTTFFGSPRRRPQQAAIDPFTKALEEARKSRASDFTRSRDQSSHKKTRSLSPFRVADILSDDHPPPRQPSAAPPSFWGAFSIPKAYRRWKIKDLLFRSASEGRATEKLAVAECPDSRRYMELSHPEEARNSSFRSAGSTSRRRSSRVPVSAHELHYKVNRAVSQEMRRKTFLPYKQGLLGCLGFVPGGGSELGRSPNGSMTRV
uniref:Calmodulin-binding protein n=1 Tax=Kalanchoe fedtschenkoi TaxID=63787 RepID=A0A7N0T3I3_KALFE